MGQPCRSPDGRFEIVEERTLSRASGVDCEDEFELRVVEVATGRVVTTFWCSVFMDQTGTWREGTAELSFTPDSTAVLARKHDGSEERRALPPPGLRTV